MTKLCFLYLTHLAMYACEHTALRKYKSMYVLRSEDYLPVCVHEGGKGLP